MVEITSNTIISVSLTFLSGDKFDFYCILESITSKQLNFSIVYLLYMNQTYPMLQSTYFISHRLLFITLVIILFFLSRSLSTYLDNLGAEYFNELLIRRLFVPFMFLCSSTRSKLIPRIIIPKDDEHPNSWISIDKYRTCVVPVLVDLYSYHVTCIRETLLEYFNSYWQLIEKTTLTDVILPQVDFLL